MSVDCGRCAPARTRFGDFARRGGATPASFRVFDTLTTSKNEEGGFARGCSRSIRTGLKVWVLEEQTRAERSTDEVEDVTSVRMNGFEGTRESSAGRS
jgi:hypothetical protein